MAVPANNFQQVQTYQMSMLGFLLNQCPFIATMNHEFKEFNKIPANLGDTVTFDRPPRFSALNTLAVNNNFLPASQLVQPLTVDKQISVPFTFTSQQMIFNAQEYMKKFGEAAVLQLGTRIEADCAQLAESVPFRFFGDGINAINSQQQLASAIALYDEYGAAKGRKKGYLPNLAIPPIIGTSLNQFVIDRNEDWAMEWMLGEFDGTDWYRSNLLPTHVSGNTGELGQTLTVVSTNDPTGANITQITVSGASNNDADAVKQYDSFQFADNVSGQPNLRFRSYIGQQATQAPVQIQATADAASNGAGQVTLNIYPALCVQDGNANQNITNNIVAGMQLKTFPSHKCGLLVGGDALYLAMPELPDMYPFPTSAESDPETKVSCRLYHGAIMTTGQIGFIHDAIWGRTGVADYCLKLMFPL